MLWKCSQNYFEKKIVLLRVLLTQQKNGDQKHMHFDVLV